MGRSNPTRSPRSKAMALTADAFFPSVSCTYARAQAGAAVRWSCRPALLPASGHLGTARHWHRARTPRSGAPRCKPRPGSPRRRASPLAAAAPAPATARSPQARGARQRRARSSMPLPRSWLPLRRIVEVTFADDPVAAPDLIGDLVHAQPVAVDGRHLEHVVDGDAVAVHQPGCGLDAVEAHALQRGCLVGDLGGATDARSLVVLLRRHVICIEPVQRFQELAALDRRDEIF